MRVSILVLPAAFSLLLPAAAAIAAPQVFTADELAERLADAPYPAQAGDSAAKTTPGTPAEIRRLLALPDGDPVVEQHLRQWALSVPEETLSPEQETLLAEVAARSSSVFVWRDEDVHRRQPVVAINPAAAARWKQERIRVAAAKRDFIARLNNGDLNATNLRSLTATAGTAAKEVFRTVPASELAALRAIVEAALPGDPVVTRLAAITAARLRDPALTLTLIRDGHAGTVGDVLPELVAAQPEHALQLLDAALERPEISIRAVAAYGPLLNQEPAARAKLLALLDDAILGPNAAATLARQHDPALQATLLEIMQSGSPRKARRAALTLYLDGDAGARAALRRYATEAGDNALATDIRQWLDH